MKHLSQIINEEMYQTDVVLDGIMSAKTGKDLAKIRLWMRGIKEEDYVKYPRFRFVFKTAKLRDDFKSSYLSNGFWKEVYDYDSLNSERNDYDKVDELMNLWPNVMIPRKKELYLFCVDSSRLNEFIERCTRAGENADYFKTFEYIK